MKTLLSVLLGLLIAGLSLAQPAVEGGAPKRSPEDLRKLLAPIALYPDALVSLILPASTDASDLVLAARYLASQGDPKEVDSQPWDESVKSLARYPEVVKWMDENLVWTKEVGEAFAVQPAEVMNTVQTLRKEAQAAGLLKDTPEQKVMVRDQDVYIEPAQEETLYVPSYDPEILVERRPVYGSWISFGAGFAVGSWLHYDCDWNSHRVVVYERQPGWRYHPGWHWRARDPLVPVVVQPWRPSPHYWQYVHNQSRHDYRPVPVVRPREIVISHDDRRDEDHRRWEERQREQTRNDQQRVWLRQTENHGQPPPNGHGQEGRRTWENRENGRANVTASTVLPRADGENRNAGDRRGGYARPNPAPGVPVSRIDNHTTPPAAVPSSPAVVAPPASNPTPPSSQNWHQLQEHRLSRPVDVAGPRTYPHEIGPPAPQHVAPPVEARVMPQPQPSRQHVESYNRPPTPSAPVTGSVREYHPAPAPASAPAAAAPAAAPVQRNNDAGNNNSAAPQSGRDSSTRDAHRVFR